MKKIFSLAVVTAMTAMVPISGINAAAANNIISGNGKNVIGITCVVGGGNSICEKFPELDFGTIFPGLGDTEIIFPGIGNDTPSEDSGNETPDVENDAPVETPEADSSLNEYEKEVIRLVNEIRVQNGLRELKTNEELSRVARIKSQDMKDNSYFSHTSPTYGSPFEMMRSFGISYITAGENIAKGQRTPQAVVDGWMGSPSHRANILNATYTEIGVGYVSGGNYWTQMFIGR